MCEAASFRALPLARWKRGVDITSPLPQPRHRATPLTVAREPRITYDIDPKWRLSQRSMTESWGRAEGGGGREGGRGDFLFSFLFIFYRPYFIWFIGLLSAMFLGLQYTTSLSPRRPHCLFVCSNSHQMGVASKVGWHKTTVGWYYVSWSLIFSLDISLFDKRLLLHPVRIQSTVAEFFRTRQRVSPHGRWCWLALVALEFYCIGRFVAVWAVIMLNGDA